MPDTFIVANWKSNKTSSESLAFLEEFKKTYQPKEEIKIVVCPSYLSIPEVARFSKENNIDIEIGAQDVSPFELGAYTGEVAASQVQEFARYVIIGHSERRANFKEDDALLEKKVSMANSSGLVPIYCVQDEETHIPEGVSIVAYEPISAIGTGQPDTPENAEAVAESIKEKNTSVMSVLYGGSVNPDNIKSFIDMPQISGVLIGGASLDPSSFSSLIERCQKNQ